MSEILLEARGLALGYGGEPVLRGVDWTVRPGEAWFLLGSNGCGKTTLVRGVLGLLPPLAGSLHLDTTQVTRDQIGFVPQRSRTHTNLPTTVREFVGLGAVGLSASARGERDLADALERSGLEGLDDRDLSALSGGQRQRALVARALVRRPRLMILDEPTEGLDVSSEEVFLETLEALRRDAGLTLVFVTHALHIAARCASHVALFAGGSVRTGPRDELLTAGLLQEAFGVPPERLQALRL